MATTTIQVETTRLTAPRNAAARPIGSLRIAAGTLLAGLLIVGLLAAAGRLLPAHPDGAEPTPGGRVGLVFAEHK